MRINRVRIHGFGAFNKGIDICLSPERLSLVIGRNEAGKSTIMSAMFGILFGFKDSALQKKFEPWEHHDRYGGEVEVLTDDGRELTIKRDFTDNSAEIGETKNGEYTEIFLGSADPRGHSDDDIQYYKLLEEIVGFQDEAVFRGTVFVGQSQLQTSITEQMRRLVSGSNCTDFKGILHDLHYRFSELTMDNPWRGRSRGKPREIERLRDTVADETKALEAARETFMMTVNLEQEIRRLERQLESDKTSLEGDRATLANFERFCKLVTDRDATRARFEESDKRRETYVGLKDKIDDIDGQLTADLKRFDGAADDFPEIVSELKREMSDLEAAEATLESERSELKNLTPTPNNNLGVALAVAGLAVGAGLALLHLIGGISAAVGLGIGLFFLGRKMSTGFKDQVAALEAKIADSKTKIEGHQNRIAALIQRGGGLVTETAPDESLATYRRCRSLFEERSRRHGAMTVLGTWTEIDGTYQKYAEEHLRCNGLMEIILRDAPYLSEIAEDAIAIARTVEELRSRISTVDNKVEVTNEVLTEAKISLAKISGDTDHDLAALEDQVRSKGSRLRGLEKERDALTVVIDTLEECVNEFQEGDLSQLSAEVSDLFRKITSNRYTRVTLSLNSEPLLTKYDNTHIVTDDLSQGTRDQLFFAIRIAIARHLSKKVALPFFLDDPFVNFDKERLEVTRDLLDQFGQHQVVMVTCDRNYENWSDDVLDLDQARLSSLTLSDAGQVVTLAPKKSA